MSSIFTLFLSQGTETLLAKNPPLLYTTLYIPLFCLIFYCPIAAPLTPWWLFPCLELSARLSHFHLSTKLTIAILSLLRPDFWMQDGSPKTTALGKELGAWSRLHSSKPRMLGSRSCLRPGLAISLGQTASCIESIQDKTCFLEV